MQSNRNEKSCPNCENDLKIHTNEQLQLCAINELSKINRKSLELRGQNHD